MPYGALGTTCSDNPFYPLCRNICSTVDGCSIPMGLNNTRFKLSLQSQLQVVSQLAAAS